MPTIVFAAFGFPLGLLFGLLFNWSAWTLAPVAAAVAASMRGPTRGRSPQVVMLCLAAGVVWGAAARHVRAADCRLQWRNGARLTIVAEPRDLAPRSEAGERVRRYDVRGPSACAGAISVRLPRPDTTDAVLVLVGTWRRDPAFDDGLLPRRPERAGRFLALTARAVSDRPSLRTRLRMGAERRLGVLFGPERWPLAAALTVSPEAAIPQETRREFSRAGLSHILSISGLHVGILAGALAIVLQAARLPPAASQVLGTMLVAAYIWMLGFPAPALRSAGLLAMWCWSRVRQRPVAPGTILAVTILLVTVFDPWTLFEPGPWLSFAGVWGCAAAASWWDRVTADARTRRARRRLRVVAPVIVSTGAVLATTPIQLLSFGTVTPVAILANLAAIPIAAFATPALALVLALSLAPGGMGLAGIAAAATGLSLDGLELVAAHAAKLPWATFDAAAPVTGAVLAALLALWMLRAGPRMRPARAVLAVRAGGAVLVAGACVAWRPLLALPAAGDGDGRLTLHFLAVGQGDATAIRTPHGRWILVDGGPRAPGLDAGARKVAPFLKRHGVRRLDIAVASHGDADHLGGLPAVLGAAPASLVLEPGVALGRPLYLEWLAALSKGGTRWHAARAGERIDVDGVTLRVWHPDSGTVAAGWEPNENSVVLTVEYGAFRALLGGDAGLPMEALRASRIGAVTLLKVGHHGSRSATGEPWLDALNPALCIIEVGERNRYGHPNPGTVARLRDRGCAVWRTDREGDITVATDGGSVTVRAAGRDTILSASKELP